jgi:hypothetical protein
MPSSEKERLVDDLLRDANYEAFRTEVHELSLVEFQTRRRSRFVPIWLGLAASLVLVGILLFVKQGKEQVSRVPRAEAIAFQKDGASVISLIETIQLEPVEIVRSIPDRSVIVNSPAYPGAGIEKVRSDTATVDRVNDAELLSLFPNETIGFVTTSRGRRLVMFAEPGAHAQARMGKTALR